MFTDLLRNVHGLLRAEVKNWQNVWRSDLPVKFSSANISAVNVVWDCGQEFKNLLPDAEFNLVASRAAQAAVLKAIKSGSSVVDLGATGSNVPSGDDDEPTNPSGPTTGGGDDDELDPLG